MPFDAMAMAASADDIRERAGGGQIQRILQPSAVTVALNVYRQGSSHWLVLSADARFARVHLTGQRLAKAFPTPSPFIMLLRKHLEGTRIADVEEVPYERVLSIWCGPPEYRVRLVGEVMGKHSNVVLVDGESRILGAIKTITPRLSRVRPILPGREYALPPVRHRDEALFGPGPRIDPARDGSQVIKFLESAPDVSLSTALMGVLPGVSPFLVAQICARAGESPGTLLRNANASAVVHAAGELFGLFQDRHWEPHTFLDTRSRPDFSPYRPLAVEEAERVESVGNAIELVLGGAESRDALTSVRAAVNTEIERALHVAERRVDSLYEGLTAAGGADEVMQRGQLILAYQWSLRPGAAQLEIPDMGMTIPLDPALSGQENAEKLFRRYRKLRDAAQRVPALIAAAEIEVERLRDLRGYAPLADTESALRELQRAVGGRDRDKPVKRSRKAARRGPLRLRHDGVTALVGRNARENEEVTFRLARRDDTWLHARERTGAHVVLGGSTFEDGTLEAAAALAAYYSEGRNDTAVDVDVAAVRDVRKISGGPPGRVTYRNFKTVRAAPSSEGWEPDGS